MRVPKEGNEDIVTLRNNRMKGSAPHEQGCDALPTGPLLVKAGQPRVELMTSMIDSVRLYIV